MKLKTKSFIHVTILAVTIFSIVGYLSLNNTKEIFENSLKKEISFDAEVIDKHLKAQEEILKDIFLQIESSEQIISSINLISKYEDKNSYNNLIFDYEKSELLKNSNLFLNNKASYSLEFFDMNRELISKKSALNGGEKFFISYSDNEKVYKDQNSKIVDDVEYKNTILSEHCIDNVTKDIDGILYKICYTGSLKFNNETIGYAKVSYYLSDDELRKIEDKLINKIELKRGADSNLYRDYTIIDRELELFAVHIIDYEYYEKKREELIAFMTFLFILVVLVAYVVFLTFINREILYPLRKLQIALESAINGVFRPIEIKSRDEIGDIFKQSNRLFEKFWDSYSSLDSYKKSIDRANLVTMTDLKGNITYANDLFCKISGYKREEIIGKPHNIVRHEDMPKETFKELWETIKSGKTWAGCVKNRTKSGDFYWVDAVISPKVSNNQEIEGYISIRRDITELMISKEQLEFSANFDILTNLKSRNRLHRDIQNSKDCALAIINIDRFSQINDFYGHEFGDRLLEIFAKELQKRADELLLKSASVYRSGGDEFAILLCNMQKDEATSKISALLGEITKTIYILDNKELYLNFSCGISFEPANNLILSADMALRLSKIEKKEFVIYTCENSLNEKYKNNIKWAKKLKDAIANDRIVPFFQPIVENATLETKKYEALVRMIDEDGKIISPFFFLDIAKQTKQYLMLTKIVIRKSFEMFKDSEYSFSINLTMEDVANDEIRDYLFGMLKLYPTIGERLVVEFVESESIEDYQRVLEFIKNLKERGVKIAIDDFGSGYSNFEYLVKLQADFIKIDGSLIKNIATNKESFVVVSTIVGFAKEMNIKTIAEFIENEEILEVTKRVGIDFSQGYYFSPPKEGID